MRLSLKYPGERVPLSWDFRRELAGRPVKSVDVSIRLARSSVIADPKYTDLLRGEPWLEDGILFQLVAGGLPGVDYQVEAKAVRDDGLVFQKVSILPVRDA